MRKLIFLIIFFISIKSFSQEPQLYRKKVDSILVMRSHNKRKTIAVKVDKTNVNYSFDFKTKELLSISYTADLDKDSNNSWIYSYYFIDGKFALLRKVKDGFVGYFRSTVFAHYYFQNDILVTGFEHDTKIENIDAQLELLRLLILKIPNY